MSGEINSIDGSKRNANYDFLRFIGISCIILAHMGPPRIIFQLRNFDVPLMVFIAGISFAQFSSNHYSSFPKYVFQRFSRLVLPTWFFLSVYNALCCKLNNESVDCICLVQQFLLIGGTDIGIWIIRIFFSMALVAPLLYAINNAIRTEKNFIIGIILIYFSYEALLFLSPDLLGDQLFQAAKNTVFDVFAYSLVFVYAMRIKSLTNQELRYHIVFFGLVFLICICFNFFEHDKFVATQRFKYPPHIYYLSYSLLVSLVLYYFISDKKIMIAEISPIQFIGRSTLWIYLWHWFFLKLYEYANLDFNFLFKYLFIYASTIGLVCLQVKLIHFVCASMRVDNRKSKFLATVFTG